MEHDCRGGRSARSDAGHEPGEGVSRSRKCFRTAGRRVPGVLPSAEAGSDVGGPERILSTVSDAMFISEQYRAGNDVMSMITCEVTFRSSNASFHVVSGNPIGPLWSPR